MTAFVARALEPVGAAFAALGASDPSYSAQLVVYHRGERVIDLVAGTGLAADSLLPVFSSSKGATGVVVGLLLQRGQLDLDARVSSYWSEFGQKGKAAITVRQALSHQAGLPGVDGGFSFEELLAHDPLATRIAAQRPFWQPGRAFAYHSLTIGTIADELVRRVDGRSVAQVLEQDVTRPRGIDVWMGTPASEDPRVAEVLLPSVEEYADPTATLPTPPVTDRIESVSMPPGGALALLPMVNGQAFRRVGPPAGGALATAGGLAKLYAALRHDVDGPRLLSDDTVAQMSQTQVFGAELGTGFDAHFGVIFQLPFAPRWPFGSFRAFGHDGAGGSMAFCDPTYDVAFGYVVQRIPAVVGMDPRAVELSRLVRQCLAMGSPG